MENYIFLIKYFVRIKKFPKNYPQKTPQGEPSYLTS